MWYVHLCYVQANSESLLVSRTPTFQVGNRKRVSTCPIRSDRTHPNEIEPGHELQFLAVTRSQLWYPALSYLTCDRFAISIHAHQAISFDTVNVKGKMWRTQNEVKLVLAICYFVTICYIDLIYSLRSGLSDLIGVGNGLHFLKFNSRNTRQQQKHPSGDKPRFFFDVLKKERGY